MNRFMEKFSYYHMKSLKSHKTFAKFSFSSNKKNKTFIFKLINYRNRNI